MSFCQPRDGFHKESRKLGLALGDIKDLRLCLKLGQDDE